MSGSDKQMLLPRVRFPEFHNDGKWRKEKLAKFLVESRIEGSTGDTAKKITVKLWGKGVFAKQESIKGSENTRYYKRRAGQFIYSKLDFLNQAFGIVPKELDGFESTVDLPCFDINDELNAVFLLEYVKRNDFYKKNGEIADGGRKAKRIQTDVFLSFPIVLPAHKDEQKKIAECLSSLDDLLTAEVQKLDALKNYKKGLLQQLFPRQGESVPRLRFPEFRNAEEWEVKTLSHYIKSLDAGVSVNSGDRPAFNDEIGILKTSCVSSRSFEHTENKVVAVPEEIARVKEPVCADTIIISRMNTIALVGANAYVEKSIPTLFLPDRLWAAKATGNGSMRFLAYVLGSEQMRTNLSSLASGSSGSMKNIGKSEVLAIRIAAPSIQEQQRIAELLSSLDKLINAQAQKTEVLKTHKKGLMQQVFPMLNEVLE